MVNGTLQFHPQPGLVAPVARVAVVRGVVRAPSTSILVRISRLLTSPRWAPLLQVSISCQVIMTVELTCLRHILSNFRGGFGQRGLLVACGNWTLTPCPVASLAFRSSYRSSVRVIAFAFLIFHSDVHFSCFNINIGAQILCLFFYLLSSLTLRPFAILLLRSFLIRGCVVLVRVDVFGGCCRLS